MSKQKPNLAAALAEAGGSSLRRAEPLRTERPVSVRARKDAGKATDPEKGREAYQSPARNGTAPITGHFPKQVRDQLKILAIERDSTLHSLMAEAYNDLFAKYGIPEIAPPQSMSVDK